MNEQDFLAAYDPHAYPAVAVTVDVVALTIRDGALHLLLIRRGEQPHAGLWALPGGFVRPDEDLVTAARRELAEETGLAGEPSVASTSSSWPPTARPTAIPGCGSSRSPTSPSRPTCRTRRPAPTPTRRPGWRSPS